jgi:hypothetical protein
MNAPFPSLTLKKGRLARVLERICEALELTSTQQTLAKDRYEAVGQWLAEAKSELLRGASVYAQGSIALGTSVRPIRQNEHDVDLVCLVSGAGPSMAPETLKTAIGDRLRENGRYAGILEEKCRCWRLNYAGEFHLDITPAILNPNCVNGGELVPDRSLRRWKPTNPRGYRKLFEARASIVPRFIAFDKALMARDADVEAFPIYDKERGILRRATQVAKRHRDMYFVDNAPELAPISVIVTTLLARSYEECARGHAYHNGYELLVDVIRKMPDFIEVSEVNGCVQWFIWNETTAGENFAEKWNTDIKLARAFFAWHETLVSELQAFEATSGLDALTERFSKSFGEMPVTKAMGALTHEVSNARVTGRLGIAASVGLTVSPAAAPVRPNTFFGSD